MCQKKKKKKPRRRRRMPWIISLHNGNNKAVLPAVHGCSSPGGRYVPFMFSSGRNWYHLPKSPVLGTPVCVCYILLTLCHWIQDRWQVFCYMTQSTPDVISYPSVSQSLYTTSTREASLAPGAKFVCLSYMSPYHSVLPSPLGLTQHNVTMKL